MIKDIAYLRKGQYDILADVLSALKGDIDIGEEIYCHQCYMYHSGCIEPKSACPWYSKGGECKCGEKGDQVNDPVITVLPLIDAKTKVTKSVMKVSLEDALMLIL